MLIHEASVCVSDGSFIYRSHNEHIDLRFELVTYFRP